VLPVAELTAIHENHHMRANRALVVEHVRPGARVPPEDGIQHLTNRFTFDARGRTAHVALEAVFRGNPRARAYVLDEQGAVRPHMVVFVDGRQVSDRQHLSDPVRHDGEIYVAQALSGG